MTPSRLARLFGPLLFGLPEDETFERTYEAYCRASNATEHLFLAFIRYQASQQPLPTRLMEHVAGYPSMLSPEIGKLEQHARSVPVTVIEANVRMYSPDLLQTACQLDIATHCEEWEACKGDDEKHGLCPQFSDKYRKLINYRGGIQGSKSKYAPLSPRLSETTPRSPVESDIDLHSSLASKEWGDFASIVSPHASSSFPVVHFAHNRSPCNLTGLSRDGPIKARVRSERVGAQGTRGAPWYEALVRI